MRRRRAAWGIGHRGRRPAFLRGRRNRPPLSRAVSNGCRWPRSAPVPARPVLPPKPKSGSPPAATPPARARPRRARGGRAPALRALRPDGRAPCRPGSGALGPHADALARRRTTTSVPFRRASTRPTSAAPAACPSRTSASIRRRAASAGTTTASARTGLSATGFLAPCRSPEPAPSTRGCPRWSGPLPVSKAGLPIDPARLFRSRPKPGDRR